MTTTEATPAADYPRDANGFPLETCGRCGGCGQYSFNALDGTRCYGCGGTGKRHPAGVVAKLAGEWRVIIRAAREVNTAAYRDVATGEVTCDLRAGDQVAHQGRGQEWRTVAGVEITDTVVGGCRMGVDANGEMILRTQTLETWITFADGTRERGGYLLRRRPDVEALRPVRDDLAARARTAYEALLARRARRARRAR